MARLLACLALAGLSAGADDPVLLAKHAACFVHAVPAWPDAEHPVERVVAPGHALFHTVRETGVMTRLVGATGTVAVNTRRISFLVTRVVGVAADAERLYVLLWRSGRIYDRPPEAGAALEGGSYELRVFWLADGAALRAPRRLTPEGLPLTAPEASLGKGPLALVEGGVTCYGAALRYEGRALKPE